MELTQSQMEQIISKGVMYGSVALGVQTEHSDLDFAIWKDDLPDFDYTMVDPSNYFEVLPQGAGLITKYPVWDKEMDILVLDKKEDLNVVSEAITMMLRIPKFLLEEKETRVDLYQKTLAHLGWKWNHEVLHFDDNEDLDDEMPF